jgi:hypothetical protein
VKHEKQKYEYYERDGVRETEKKGGNKETSK